MADSEPIKARHRRPLIAAATGSLSDKSSESGTQVTTATARTTASHNIAAKATKAGNIRKNKAKDPKGKKKDTAPEPEPDSLSDEDDSREREAALSSPIKGKISRELNEVSQLISLIILLITMIINLRRKSEFARQPSRHPSPVHPSPRMPNRSFPVLFCQSGFKNLLRGIILGDLLMLETAKT